MNLINYSMEGMMNNENETKKLFDSINQVIDDKVKAAVDGIDLKINDLEKKQPVIVTKDDDDPNRFGLFLSNMARAHNSNKSLQDVYSEQTKSLPKFVKKGMN